MNVLMDIHLLKGFRILFLVVRVSCVSSSKMHLYSSKKLRNRFNIQDTNKCFAKNIYENNGNFGIELY